MYVYNNNRYYSIYHYGFPYYLLLILHSIDYRLALLHCRPNSMSNNKYVCMLYVMHNVTN